MLFACQFTHSGYLTGVFMAVIEQQDADSFVYQMDTRVKWGILPANVKQQSSFTWRNGIALPDEFEL
jgi:hypothetical protein